MQAKCHLIVIMDSEVLEETKAACQKISKEYQPGCDQVFVVGMNDKVTAMVQGVFADFLYCKDEVLKFENAFEHLVDFPTTTFVRRGDVYKSLALFAPKYSSPNSLLNVAQSASPA